MQEKSNSTAPRKMSGTSSIAAMTAADLSRGRDPHGNGTEPKRQKNGARGHAESVRRVACPASKGSGGGQ